MIRRDRLAVVGLLLALAIVGAALVVGNPASPASASIRPTGGGVPYREGIVGHPSSINPLTSRTQADKDLVALLFRGLVKDGPDGTVVPDLATWTISSDGRTYTFAISNDAYWEDGQPVTSADVVFTISMLQDSLYDGPVGSSWQGIHATAETPSTVRFDMTLAIAGFLRQAELPILPAHLLSGVKAPDLADSIYSSRPVGDGPYRIVALDYSHALLSRVPTVTGVPLPTPTRATPSPSPSASSSPVVFATATPPSKAPAVSVTPVPTDTPAPTPPPTPTPTPRPTATPQLPPLASGTALASISSLQLNFYDDTASAAAAFEAGQIDVVSGLAPEQIDAALKTAGSRLVPYQWASLISVVLNQRSDHLELRDANAHTGFLAAIDRNSILSKILEGRGSIADLPISDWNAAYQSTSVTTTPYDVLAAQGYLTTAGWVRSTAGWTAPKGKSVYSIVLLTLNEASNPVVYRTAVQVAAAWSAIGFDVQIKAVPTADYVGRLDAGDFTAAIVNFQVGLDPDLGPLLLSSQVGSGGSNVSGLQDPQLDQLLLAARKTVDPAARLDAISAVEKYVSTTLPILPLTFRDYDLVVSSRVRNVISNQIADPSDRFWDVIDWRLASDR